jgi:acetate kinase
MNMEQDCILTINGGSSSIRFALFQMGEPLLRLLWGKIDRIGQKDSKLVFEDGKENRKSTLKAEAADHQSAVNFLIDWLEKLDKFPFVRVVGHRVVHGMNHTEPELITDELLDELCRIIPYDPDHLPAEIELIEAFRQRHPKLLQMACFDTSFHCTMPRVAKLLPIPRRFDAKGIRRYGFHGLSYAYLMEELDHVAGAKAAQGRVILAHLGAGASLAAVCGGKSIDTSMGFTPAAGLIMGSRPGDLDPGVAWYLMQTGNLTPQQFNNLINHF